MTVATLHEETERTLTDSLMRIRSLAAQRDELASRIAAQVRIARAAALGVDADKRRAFEVELRELSTAPSGVTAAVSAVLRHSRGALSAAELLAEIAGRGWVDFGRTRVNPLVPIFTALRRLEKVGEVEKIGSRQNVKFRWRGNRA